MSDERRKAQRFPIALPIEFGSGGKGITRDISGLGVYFETNVAMEAGSEIDFFLIVPDALDVRCHGVIVRVEDRGTDQFGIAATILSYESSHTAPITDFDTPQIIIQQLRAHHQ